MSAPKLAIRMPRFRGADQELKSYLDRLAQAIEQTVTGLAPNMDAPNTPVTIAQLVGSASYATDVAAAAGGVQIGQLYRNGSAVQVRVS